MLDIPFLTGEVERLNESVAWWNQIRLAVGFVAILLAMVSFVAHLRSTWDSKTLEDVRLQLTKAKEAPRTFSDPQRERLIEKLRPFSGTSFVVVTYPGEPEALQFSTVIAETLVQAGWALNPNDSRGSLTGLASGVVVVIGSQAGLGAEKAGTALLEALKSEGVAEARLGRANLQVNPTPIAIKVQVAKKP